MDAWCVHSFSGFSFSVVQLLQAWFEVFFLKWKGHCVSCTRDCFFLSWEQKNHTVLTAQYLEYNVFSPLGSEEEMVFFFF